MPKLLRALIVEDVPLDRELLLHELERVGFDVRWKSVETSEDFSHQLTHAEWDVVLSDFRLPSFGGREALEILKKTGLDLPFLVVSGTIGDEQVVAMMRLGASDCVAKDNLNRLGGAVERELKEAENRRARRRAEERAQQLAAVVDSSIDPIISESPDGTITSWNPAAERLFGWSAEEAIGRHDGFTVPPERMAELAEVMGRLDRGERVEGLETVRLDRAGHRIDVAASFSPVRSQDGQLAGVSKIFRDITVLKRAEAERDRVLQQLRLQIDCMPLAYVFFGADLRVADWNAAAHRIFEYTKDEVLGMGPPWEKILPASARAHGEEILRQILGGARAANTVNENVTKNGRRIVCEWFNTPLLDASGNLTGIMALAQDVTERQRTADELVASNERFQQIAGSIREVFWLSDPAKGEIAYVSPAYEEIWGRSCESLYASPRQWSEALHSDDRERVLAAASTQASGLYDEEYRIVRPDGSMRWIRDRAFPVRDASGRVVRIAGVAEDTTERRSLEAQLHQAQKMDAIGQLAGGIAHDFNNLLTVITGYSELLLESMADDDPHRHPVEEIVAAGVRSAALTRQLLAFSRKQVLATTVLDLNQVVRDAEAMMRRLIGEDVALSTDLDPALQSVKGDRGQLEQVILNLAVNARDAMPRGGVLTIATRGVQVDESAALRHPGLRVGPHVELSVADSGTGIREEVIGRLFEPFFTTKEPGKGTGLGLAVVDGVIRQSGGCIEVESEPGRGTCFRILLPAVAPSPRPVATAKQTMAARGTETLLLAEDEDGVRSLALRVLRELGYDVLVAADGNEALRVAASHGGAIDLLITDVVMPNLGGRALVDRIREVRPAIKVLYLSGYLGDAIMRHGVAEQMVNFLSKPFSPSDLAAKVRDTLSS